MRRGGILQAEGLVHPDFNHTAANHIEQVSSHALQIADMIRAIRENGTPLVDGYAGRQPVEIILSIYESARTHREITLL